MEFESLVFNNAPIWKIMGAAFGMLAIGFLFMLIPTKKHTKLFTGISIGIMIASVFAPVVAFGFYQEGEEKRLNQAFINNIITKYDVDGVEDELTGNRYGHEEGELFEAVVNVDGTRYEFLIEYDAETGEPTLIDPPVKGGQAPTEALTADELIRS